MKLTKLPVPRQNAQYLLDEFHSWWHKFEMGAFRTTVVAVGVIAILVVLIIVQFTMLSGKDSIIRHLSESQMMIGFPNEEGVFVSSSKIPQYFVVRYARSFVNNFLIYGPTGVKENMDEARRMMEPQLAVDFHKYFQDTINEARQDYITQNFEIEEMSFRESRDGFIVKFRGILTKFAAQTQLGPQKEKIITVRIKRIAITESTKEGMVIAGVSDKLSFDKGDNQKSMAVSRNEISHGSQKQAHTARER